MLDFYSHGSCSILRQPESLSSSQRRRLSDIQVQCFVYEMLRTHSHIDGSFSDSQQSVTSCFVSVAVVCIHMTCLSPFWSSCHQLLLQLVQELSSEFRRFLSTNTDYEASKALYLLLSHSLLSHYLLCAHTRKMMRKALDVLAKKAIFGVYTCGG